MKHLVANLLLIIGAGFLMASGFLIWQRNVPSRLAFAAVEMAQPTAHTNLTPKIISIPDLRIALPIIAAIHTKSWEVTSEGVSYLTSSPIPGEMGNSILYGHNWPNLLGRLTQARPGQLIEIRFSDGSQKEFEIKYTAEVTPDQSHILSQTQDHRITIYTCSGFLDSKRFVVVAIAREDASSEL